MAESAAVEARDAAVLDDVLELIDGEPLELDHDLFENDVFITLKEDDDANKELLASLPRQQRQRAELEYLRVKVRAFEDQLARLRDDQGSDSNGGEEGQVDGSLAMAWKRVAERQYDQRVAAELENTKLRKVLQQQLKIAHSLKKVLQKRRSFAALESALWTSAKRARATKASEKPEDAVYEELGASVTRRMELVDEVFAQHGLVSRQAQSPEFELLADDPDGLGLRYSETRHLPFTVQAMSNALWTCLGIKHMTFQDGFYECLEKTDATARIRMSINFADVIGAVTVMISWRRHVQADRHVLVWESCARTTPGCVVFGVRDLGCHERGQTIIEPLQSALDTESPEATGCVFRSCVRLTHSVSVATLRRRNRVGLFSELAFSSYVQRSNSLLRIVESTLLEQLRRESSGSVI